MLKAKDPLDNILKKNRIIPVIVIDAEEHAIPLAQTLVNLGFTTLEITLRTPSALSALKQISENVQNVTVGVGTVVCTEQLHAAQKAGAQFAVSPGISRALVAQAKKIKLPFLPGIATASEALLAHELELTHVKFFPAESMGGIKTLSALSEILPSLYFCPTGGIYQNNFIDYLKLGCVPSVGGSWIAPRALIQKNALEDIVKHAEAAKKTLADILLP